MTFFQTDNEDEVEELDDEEAALADDLLDEVGDEAVADDDLEGFGLLDPESVIEKEDEESDEETEDELLDEDAEEVDFDTFDDIDEM